MIRLQNIGLKYDRGGEVLRDVSFHLRPGSFHFLTGPSGAGKSTLLKLIPAIERPTQGSVVVNGQNVAALKRAAVPYLRRNLGMIFQDQKLLYDRSAFDNVVLPLALPGLAAGSVFTFSLTLGDYIIPSVVGAPGYFIGMMVYQQQGTAGNLPLAAAFSVVPIVLISLYLALAKRLGAFDAL